MFMPSISSHKVSCTISVKDVTKTGIENAISDG